MSFMRRPTRTLSREILGLAVPIMLASLSQTLMSLIDIAMVGRLGAAAIAAVGLGGILTFAISSLFNALQTGVQTLVARRRGEGKSAEAVESFRVAFYFTLITGNLLAALYVLAAPRYFYLLNADPDVVSIGASYLQFRGWSMGIVMLGSVFYGFYNGIGKTRIHMIVTITANVLNVVLNYGLIFGRFGLPALGAPGAGQATALASIATTSLYAVMALTPFIRRQYPGLWYGTLSRSALWRVLRLALPAGLHEFGTILGFTIFMILMGMVSTVALAASEILINIISFSFLPASGFLHACQTLVSQSLGQRNPGRAQAITETATTLCILFMGALGVLFITVPTPILRLFTTDMNIIQQAKAPLQIVGMVQFLDAIGMVHYGALRGAGDVVFPAVAELLLMWLLFLPLTYVTGITLGWGLVGGWIAVAVHLATYSITFLLRFRYGSWKKIVL